MDANENKIKKPVRIAKAAGMQNDEIHVFQQLRAIDLEIET